MFVGDDDGQDP